MKYKDRIEMITLMLRSSNADNGSAKTKIMYESFLTFAQQEEYLFLLLRNGLLEYNGTNRTYKTTDKGLRLLELFNKLNELLDTRIRQKAIRIPKAIMMFIATIAIQGVPEDFMRC
jgi:predicted transcriptional regulator